MAQNQNMPKEKYVDCLFDWKRHKITEFVHLNVKLYVLLQKVKLALKHAELILIAPGPSACSMPLNPLP